MSDLEAKIRIGIVDAYSAALKQIAGGLENVKVNLKGIEAVKPFVGLNEGLEKARPFPKWLGETSTALRTNAVALEEWAKFAGEPVVSLTRRVEDMKGTAQRVVAPMAAAARSVEDFATKMQRVRSSFQLAGDLNQAAEGMGRFASGLTMVLRKPFDEFQTFEQSMSKVAALTNEIGTEGFQKMKALAQELGATTSYSSQQAADAMAAFGQQGLTVDEILKVTPQTLALARGGMIDLGQAAQILGTSMAGMGLHAEDAKRVVDVLAQAANAANTDVAGLGNAFSYVGPLAKDAGMSFEMTAAMLGKLADAGMDSNRAGTGLRAVMSRLLSPSTEASKALRQYGFSVAQIAQLQKDAANGRLDLSLKAMGEMGAKLPDEKRLRLLSDIFGQEAVSAGTALMSAKLDVTSGKGLDDLVEKLNHAQGAAQRAARVMEDNLAGELERTGGAISDLSIKLGERLKPSIVGIAKAIQTSVGNLDDWAQKNPDTANAIVRTTALITGGALLAKGITLTAGAAVTALGLLKGTIAGISTAWGVGKDIILGIPKALALAKDGFLAFDAALTGASALTALKWVGLAAAAGAAGYALGTWADQTWHFSDKLANVAMRIHDLVTGMDSDYEKSGQSGFKKGDDQIYGDGTVIGANGEVKTLGSGPGKAPKAVREAMDAGARTKDEVNAYIRRHMPAHALRPGEGPMPKELTPYAGGGPSYKPAFDVMHDVHDATREQTREVVQTLREVVKAQKETSQAVKDMKRPQRDIGWAEYF